MMDHDIQVLLIGEWDDDQMRPIVEFLKSPLCNNRIRFAHDIGAAVRLLTVENWFPDLVVVCQSWSDEFSRSDVEELLRVFPLARLVCCFGAWCESDGRSRAIWPLSVRIPARSAVARIRHELHVLSETKTPLPRTASRDEIYDFDSAEPILIECQTGMQSLLTPVFILTSDRELRIWLHEQLRSAGFRLLREAEFPSAQVVVWDADPWNNETADRLRGFRARNPDARVVALMGMAHPEDVAFVQACGANAVVAKLTSVHELMIELCHS